MERLTIAYVLIVLLVAALAGCLAHVRYNSHERTVRRRRDRERAAREDRKPLD